MTIKNSVNLSFFQLITLTLLASCAGHRPLECDPDDVAYQVAAGDNNVEKMAAMEENVENEIDQDASCRRHPETPIIRAARAGAYEAVERLINNGADINAQTKKGGTTALMAAAEEGHGVVVVLLLESGARVNIQSQDGNTALLLAARANHAEVIRILVRNHAELDVRNKNGETPYSWARRHGDEELQNLLRVVQRTEAREEVRRGTGFLTRIGMGIATLFAGYTAYQTYNSSGTALQRRNTPPFVMNGGGIRTNASTPLGNMGGASVDFQLNPSLDFNGNPGFQTGLRFRW